MADRIETEVFRYLDHLTVERGLSPNTVAAYRRDLGRYVCVPRDARRDGPGRGRRGHRAVVPRLGQRLDPR